MVVRIRLARFGKAHAPVYNIVVMNARKAPKAKPIEVIGTYDPIPKVPSDGIGKPFKDIQLDTTRAKYWLGVGAQPSDPVWRLLSMHGLIAPKWKTERLKVIAGEDAVRPKEQRKLKGVTVAEEDVVEMVDAADGRAPPPAV